MASPYLPPLPGVPQRRRPKKSIIVQDSLLTQGKTEYEITRAQRLTPLEPLPSHVGPTSMSHAMRGVGDDLQNSEVAKDKTWWQTTLGVLEPLKYLDIPVEMLLEVPEGIIGGRWAGEGTAPREDFQAWKALFGSKDVSAATGFGEFKARLDKASEGFSNRPLWMQLGVGAVQVGATFGAGAVAKGAAMSGSVAARYAAKTARGAAYAMDMTDLGLSMAGRSYKALRRSNRGDFPLNEDFLVHPINNDPLEHLNLPGGQFSGKHPETYFTKDGEDYRIVNDLVNEEDGLEVLTPDLKWEPIVLENQEEVINQVRKSRMGRINASDAEREISAYSTRNNREKGSQRYGTNTTVGGENVPIRRESPEYTVRKGKEEVHMEPIWKDAEGRADISPVLHIGNELRRLFGDLHEYTKTNAPDSIRASRDLALIQLIHSMASRPGVIERVTVKTLKDFVKGGDWGQLKVKAARGERSGLLHALDRGEASWAVNDYLQRLEKYVGEGRLTDGYGKPIKLAEDGSLSDDMFAFGLDFGADPTGKTARLMTQKKIGGDSAFLTNQLIKEYSSGQNMLTPFLEGFSTYRLPKEGHQLRNQRVSEIWLEGAMGFPELMSLLRHSQAAVTRGYINDIDWNSGHQLSRPDSLRSAEVQDLVEYKQPKASDRPEISRYRDDMAEEIRNARKEGTTGKRKGDVPGGAGRASIIADVGEHYLYSNLVTKHLEDNSQDLLDKLAAFKHEVGGEDTRAYLWAERLVRLDALKYIALNQSRAFMRLEQKYYGIVSKPKALQQQGKLVRAGYEVVGRQRNVKLVTPKWDSAKLKKRQKFAEDTGLVEKLGDGMTDTVNSAGVTITAKESKALWDEWANRLIHEASTIQETLDEVGRLHVPILDKKGVPTGTTKKLGTGFAIHNALAEYVDINSANLLRQFGDFIVSHDNVFEQWKRLAVMTAAQGAGTSNRFNLSNYSGQLKAVQSLAIQRARQYNHLSPTQEKSFHEIGEFSTKIDELVDDPTNPGAKITYREQLEREGRWHEGDEVPSTFVSIDQDAQVRRLADWLSNDDIRSLFESHQIGPTTRIERLRGVIKKWAEGEDSGIFGVDFGKWRNELIAQGKRAELDTYIDNVTGLIFRNRKTLMDGFQSMSNKRFKILEARHAKKMAMPFLRRTEMPEGNMPNSSGTVATLNYSIETTKPRLSSKIEDNAWVNKLRSKSATAWIPNHILPPMAAILTGGRGPAASAVGRLAANRQFIFGRLEGEAELNANMINYTLADKEGVIGHGLGVVTDTATDEMRAIGINEGNQWLSGIKLHATEDIIQFEQSDFARNAYKRVGEQAGLKGFKPAYEKIVENTNFLRTTDDIEIQNLNSAQMMADPLNMLRQVDVVLERIPHELWEYYFDLTAKQRETLYWLKNIVAGTDQTARDAEIDIVTRIADKGGKYLSHYFPRLFRRGNTRTKLGDRMKNSVDRLAESNYMSHFEARSQNDIIDILSGSFGTEVATGDKLRRTVMEDVGTRIGLYTESMHKEIIEAQFLEAIKATDAWKHGLTRAGYAGQHAILNSLEAALKFRLDGKVGQLPNQLIEPMEHELANGYAWLADDLPSTLVRARDEAEDILKWIGDESTKLGKEMGGLKHDSVTADGWLNAIFKGLPADAQNELRMHMESAPPALLKPIEWLARGAYGPTNVFRTFKAGMDLGAGFIHGYNALMRIPNLTGETKFISQRAFGTAQKNMFKFWTNPEAWSIHRAEHYEMIQAAMPWIKLGHAEPLMGLEIMGGTIGRARVRMANFLNNAPEFAKKVLTTEEYNAAVKAGGAKGYEKLINMDVIKRFETAFIGFTDTLRLELWKGFEPSVKRQLFKMAEEDPTILVKGALNFKHTRVIEMHHELGAVINKMTGVFDQELAGATPFQRLLETSLLFFAPMYRRATFGVMADIARGGIRGREARRQIGGVVGAGALMSYLITATTDSPRADAVGDDGELDLTARFGKVRFMDTQTGFGTAWMTALRLGSDLAMMSPLGGDAPVENEYGKHWFADNPIVELLGRRGRSQVAPGAGFLLDIVNGRTFTGDPLRDEEGGHDIAKIGLHLGRQMVPFWLDEGIKFKEWDGGTPIMMAGEFFGLQSYRVSEYDQLAGLRQSAVEDWNDEELVAWRKDQLKNGERIDWVSLPKLLQDRIDNEVPEVVFKKEKFEKHYGQIATGNAKLFREYQQQKAQFDLRVQQMISAATLQFERGQIDGQGLKQLISNAKAVRSSANASLLDSPKFANLQQWFSDLRMSRSKKDKAYQGDMIYDKYMSDVVFNELNYDDDGLYNWENNRILKTEFIKAQGLDDEWLDYIEKRRLSWLDNNPVAMEYEAAKSRLKPYWQIHDKIWAVGTEGNRIATWYSSKSRTMRNELAQKYPQFNDIKKRLESERSRLRDSRPDLDWLLVKWYNLTPRHRSSESLKEQWQATNIDNRRRELMEGRYSWRSPDPNWFDVTPAGRVILDRTKPTTRQKMEQDRLTGLQ